MHEVPRKRSLHERHPSFPSFLWFVALACSQHSPTIRSGQVLNVGAAGAPGDS
jgi:hypothetical protein